MIEHKHTAILAVLLVISIITFSCSSDDNLNAITGVINNANGNPVVNAKVVVTYDLKSSIGRGSVTANQPNIGIQFGIEEEQNVRVTIKESETEKQLVTLFDQKTAAGMYTTVWDRKDENGILQPGGIYIAEIDYELKEDESFALPLNITDYEQYSYEEVKELTVTGQDGDFTIRRDQLLHHHSLLELIAYEPTGTVTLQAFDEQLGLSAEKEIKYSTSRSSPEKVTLQFTD